MTTRREQVLTALFERMRTVPEATIRRNEPLPEKVPAGGLVVLRDGDPGEPEVVLSPLTYLWTHRAVVEAIVSGATPAARDTALDDLLASLGEAIAGDRTLGGRCDHIEAGAPDVGAIAVEGGAPLKGATVTVTLVYATTDPLA
ncbi:MAG: acyl-CoA transferase [Alphaproteobacteria bacterium]|nr:acyl-CoA transferase [Alphaproteobacteria bacterium]